MYRHADGNIANTGGVSTSIDDFDAVIAGALMKF